MIVLCCVVRSLSRTLTFMVLIAGFSAVQADELEGYVDRVGMDYKRIVLPVAEPLLCQSECVSDDLCQAFTYVKPQVEAQEAICYLKDGVGTPQFSDCCTSGLRPNVTHALSESVIYQTSLAALAALVGELGVNDPIDTGSGPIFEAASASGKHDTLMNYAKKCDLATGITVPPFSCASGVLISGQGNTAATTSGATQCNRPNVLNSVCDPGSRFLVLPGKTADAVAVALCRKTGINPTSNKYGDIAVIQHNKKNGATCFYQALGTLTGNVPAPKVAKVAGTQVWQSGSRNSWMSPAATEAIGCTGCHDNGAFIRSPYLAQLTTPPHALPTTSQGYNNLNTPLKYVGNDFSTNRSWSVKLASPSVSDSSCVACHRLAVSNFPKFQGTQGTAGYFAVLSTLPTQASKNPHSIDSPIWMAPGQTVFSSVALASSKKYEKCARDFYQLNGSVTLLNSPNTVQAPPGCLFEPLAGPWQP